MTMGKRNKVTTRDIAEYAGVSQSTVSMILSEKKNVSFGEETVENVKKAAKALGYHKPAKKKRQEEADAGPLSLKDRDDPLSYGFQRLL